jgi:hypothetical protein
MPFGFHLEAEYESGHVVVQGEDDTNPWGDGNTFTAIRTHAATENGHGALVRLSLVGDSGNGRYDIDWKALADRRDVRPIYFRDMHRSKNLDTGEDSGPVCDFHHFGYQYLDDEGFNVQEVEDIPVL